MRQSVSIGVRAKHQRATDWRSRPGAIAPAGAGPAAAAGVAPSVAAATAVPSVPRARRREIGGRRAR